MPTEQPYLAVDRFRPLRLYIPALVIVALVFGLLIFIGFSTYWNLYRARSNAMHFLHQQGVAIIQAMEAGVESAGEAPRLQENIVQRLLAEVSENEAVAHIYLVGPANRRMRHTPGFSPAETPVWRPAIPDSRTIITRTRRLENETPVYELAKRFVAFNPPAAAEPPVSDSRGTHSMVPDTVGHEHNRLVIGLKMSIYEKARHEDLQHAAVMVSILAALGLGTGFFVFVIGRYHRMNRILRETQRYTRRVVESMANGLLSIDDQGNILTYNHLGLELVGLEESDVPDTKLEAIIDMQASGISRTLDTGEPVMDREIRVALSNGEARPLAVSVTAINRAPGAQMGAVIILRDLSEIKQLEERVRRTEKLAALGKLAAAVAHEIRNPLSSIRGFAGFLSHVLKDRPEDKAYADVMVAEVDRISRVVTDLLNLARPLEIEPATVDPAQLVLDTVRLVQSDAAEKQVRIDAVTKNAPAAACLDPNLMRQLLLNLMLNAVAATGAGNHIEIGVQEYAGSAGTVFWVQDDGPGIESGHRKKIFDPFFTTREKGTGLGLAIVLKIVENHSGAIRLESPLPGREKGCRFVVEIPDAC